MAVPREDKYTVILYHYGTEQERLDTYNFREARDRWAKYDQTSRVGCGAVELRVNGVYVPYVTARKMFISGELRKKRWNGGTY